MLSTKKPSYLSIPEPEYKKSVRYSLSSNPKRPLDKNPRKRVLFPIKKQARPMARDLPVPKKVPLEPEQRPTVQIPRATAERVQTDRKILQ
jgi:hypothetical protein